MSKRYTKIYSRTLLLAIAMLLNFSFPANSVAQKSDTTFLHLNRLKKDKNILKNFHVSLPAVKPYVFSSSKPTASTSADDKLLSNVQIYPNPVTDQINIKYSLSRSANVNIKIMDLLGNEVVNLFSQHVEPGEWKATQNIKTKLNSGFYFIRIVVGTESVIRRISIL